LLLQLNVHDLSVIADGVFAVDAVGQLTFLPLPPPSDVEAIALGIASWPRSVANARGQRSWLPRYMTATR